MRVVDDLGNELNQEITDRLIDVVYRLLCDDELQLAVLLRQKLIQKWKALHELRVQPLAYLRTVPDPTSRAKKMTDFKSRQLAEQMSLLDMKFFQNIEVHEMLLWAEEQNEEKNPSLTAFTAHFNNVSGWCRTQLMLNKDPKEREKVALKLLKVMKHLRLMSNFNSYLAILSAMDSAAISRLDWSDEVIKGLEEPHALIDNTSSFKSYRIALKNAIPPCIPYMYNHCCLVLHCLTGFLCLYRGMFLQDLTFLHLGSPSFLDKEKKFVNFTKRWKQFNVLKKIRQCQQVEYQFERDEAVVRVFNKFENYLGEEQIYQRSLQYKPRMF
jgi:Rap guanine nucleotide exchange factor 1